MKRGSIAVVVMLLLVFGSVAWGAAPGVYIPFTKTVGPVITYPGTYTLRFSLWDTQAIGAGNMVWSEEKANIKLPDDKTIKVNLGTTVGASLAALDFSQQYFVQVDKKEANGSYTTDGARTRWMPVPYAMWSDFAESGGSISAVTAGAGLTGGGNLGDLTLNVGAGSGISVAADQVSIRAGGVTNVMLANGAVTNAKIAAGAVTDASITGPISASKISPAGLNADTVDGVHASGFVQAGQANSVTNAMITNGAVTLSKISATGATANQVLGYNGTALRWQNAAGFSLPYAGTASAIGDAFSITTSGTTGIRGISSGSNGNGVVGIADNGTGAWGVYGKSAAGVGVIGKSTTGYAGKFFGKTYFDGNVGIGTLTPTQKLEVNGAYLLVDGLGSEKAYMGGDGNGDVQLGSLNSSVTGVTLINGTTGQYMDLNVGAIYTPTQNLRVVGEYLTVNGLGGEQAYMGGDGNGDVQFGSLNSAVTGVTLINGTTGNVMDLNVGVIYTPTQNLRVAGEYLTVNGLGYEQAYMGGDGNGDVQFGSLNSAVTGVALINGTTGQYMDVGVRTLHIMGGADLAEPFDVREHEKIKPGMLLTIDADNPGKLRMSETAYDRTVAGVVSGAGGINPGVTMQQDGSTAQGNISVALTGRVYCMADASKGTIKPGDMLTTSDIPGHAMKVTDHAKGQGAIIGKAMTGLDKGTGLVLVLVTLQ